MTVLALDPTRRTNAHLIADMRQLGHINADDHTVDLTYGLGRWWRDWKPDHLVANDINPQKGETHRDFRATNWNDDTFDVAVFDPPYGLRGTSRLEMDNAYGLDRYRNGHEINQLLIEGVREACRIARRRVIVKCQDQVAGGRMWWQTITVHQTAAERGWVVRDELHLLVPVPQPDNARRQRHARQRGSTMLALAPGWST